MSEQDQNVAMSDTSQETRPGISRFRGLLRDALFILGLVGLYLVVMLFVLPRLGYET